MEIWEHRLPYKLVRPGARAPHRATEHSAGLDLHYSSEVIGAEPPKAPGHVHKLGTGIAVEIPHKYVGFIRLRSSWATKNDAIIVSSSIIDSDYRGELIVPVQFLTKPCEMQDGDRFAQLVILPYLTVRPVQREELSDTIRGVGGFGSTSVPSPFLNQVQAELIEPEQPKERSITSELLELFALPQEELRPRARKLGERIGEAAALKLRDILHELDADTKEPRS